MNIFTGELYLEAGAIVIVLESGKALHDPIFSYDIDDECNTGRDSATGKIRVATIDPYADRCLYSLPSEITDEA